MANEASVSDLIALHTEYAAQLYTMYTGLAIVIAAVGLLVAAVGLWELNKFREIRAQAREKLEAIEKGSMDVRVMRINLEILVDMEIARNHINSGDFSAAAEVLDGILKASDYDMMDRRVLCQAHLQRAFVAKRVENIVFARHQVAAALFYFESSVLKEHPASSSRQYGVSLFNAACYAAIAGDFENSLNMLEKAFLHRPELARDINDDDLASLAKHEKYGDELRELAKTAQTKTKKSPAAPSVPSPPPTTPASVA